MIVPLPAIYTDKQARAMRRVLHDLSRADERLQAVYGKQRSHERASYHGVASVIVQEPMPGATKFGAEWIFEVCARDVSRSGVSFIHTHEFHETSILICLDAQADQPFWMRAEVVRARPVQEGFWEYGVKFKGKAAR